MASKRAGAAFGAVAIALSAVTACSNDGGPMGLPAPTVSSVSVTPALASLVVGMTLQLSATARDLRGNPIARALAWASSNPAILTVSASGLVTALAPGGPVAVTAQAEGKSAAALITVSAAVIATVEVTSGSDTVLARGRTAELVAVAKDASGGRIVPTPSTTWSTSDPSVATIANSGLLTALAVGRVTVTAVAGGVQGRLTVLVVDADLPAVQLLLVDKYLARAVDGLTAAVLATVQAAFASSTSALASGNVLSVASALDAIRSQSGSATDSTDRTLLAVLQLFTNQIERLLHVP